MDETRISEAGADAPATTQAEACGVARAQSRAQVNREAVARAQFERFTPPGGVEEFPPYMAERAKAVFAYWNGPDAR